jgi:uncharacterized protein (TIGR03118 family)
MKRARSVFATLLLGTAFSMSPPSSHAATPYQVQYLVSDGVVSTPNPTDASLLNPWGITTKGTGPFWIANNNSGTSTFYGTDGAKFGQIAVAPPVGINPTGIVANDTTGFKVSGNPAAFIFDGEDGTVSAWNGGSASTLEFNNSANAVYKGLAIGNSGGANFLYATNFRTGNIDVYDTNFAPTTLSGNFTDPGLTHPTPGNPGFAPFGINNIGGNIYVTYALQNAAQHDDVEGAGNGFVDIYSTSGVFEKRLISNGHLNSPWGLALAPANFGTYSNDLLVGNFGNSEVNAYDPNNGTYLGSLLGPDGQPLLLSDAREVKGLWGLLFGNGGSGGLTDSLYFTAGANSESDGIFGSISVSTATVPLPAALPTSVAGMAGLALIRLWRKTRAI